MNQSYRSSNLSSAVRLCGTLGILCLSSGAMAQSAGAFATSPYVPLMPAAKPSPAACVCAEPKQAVAPSVAPKPMKPEPQLVGAGGQILPIVMFRGTPAAPLPKPAVVSMVPVAIALPTEPQKPAAPVILAPPPVAAPAQQIAAKPAPAPAAKREKPAGPFKRIWRDTKKSVVQDIPEALADALPWVDRGAKDEPIEQVLARVSSDLSRASAQDPEWVNPAESELRELSKRLATLAEPPADTESAPTRVSMPEQDSANRPFRPRPIWPGASGRPEMQSRPTALVTGSTIQQGPEAVGQRLPPPTDWVEDEEKAPKPPAQQVVAKRAKRPSK
ncbi:hypothetical protein [Aquidulcibacter sp.]|uniref:hypothetical protein n=1 Tax=Aquidulcibacter sp. TaxID=2052990 RepID=UPI003BA668FF